MPTGMQPMAIEDLLPYIMIHVVKKNGHRSSSRRTYQTSFVAAEDLAVAVSAVGDTTEHV